MILGIGSILYSDEGFGIRVAEELEKGYAFPGNVSVVDGGVLGMNLLGMISEADHLIVIDAVKSKGKPGDFYRIDGKELPGRIRAKNSLHQIDFMEALTLCQVLEKVPETVVLGMEPEDIETLSPELTDTGKRAVPQMVLQVLTELNTLGIEYTEKNAGY